MGDMLSQAEIDALLNGTLDFDNNDSTDSENLTSQEIDALGEIGNISMGTSATTLFTLLGQKVTITTPKVEVTTWDELSKVYSSPYVAVRVEYKEGLLGSNLLIMKESDVKIITDLMMGGEGTNIDGELTELHLSAISEAMNQMVGSSATSLSSMFDKRVDISPPKSFIIHFDSEDNKLDVDMPGKIVKIAFKIVVGDLIDSEIMQILPVEFAKDLVDNLLGSDNETPAQNIPEPPISQPIHQQMQAPKQETMQQMNNYQQQYNQAPQQMDQGLYYPSQNQMGYSNRQNTNPVNVQPAQFEAFDMGGMDFEKKNISLIMDVPLQITVELGRTQRMIKEILEFGQGSIIELDKLAGDPVDILVNGKPIAKGEVVVIDESFGVRITDIIHPSKRL